MTTTITDQDNPRSVTFTRLFRLNRVFKFFLELGIGITTSILISRTNLTIMSLLYTFILILCILTFAKAIIRFYLIIMDPEHKKISCGTIIFDIVCYVYTGIVLYKEDNIKYIHENELFMFMFIYFIIYSIIYSITTLTCFIMLVYKISYSYDEITSTNINRTIVHPDNHNNDTNV